MPLEDAGPCKGGKRGKGLGLSALKHIQVHLGPDPQEG